MIIKKSNTIRIEFLPKHVELVSKYVNDCLVSGYTFERGGITDDYKYAIGVFNPQENNYVIILKSEDKIQ